MRERESLFNEFLIEVRRREKEEKSQRREQVRLIYVLQFENEMIGNHLPLTCLHILLLEQPVFDHLFMFE